MKSYQISAAGLVKAPLEQVYAILADYHNGHLHILPKQFINLEVEQGGIGAGTIIRFQMWVMGKTQSFRTLIGEAEPGRVLVETDADSGVVTTFTVAPLEAGQHTQVTFLTELKQRSGIQGQLERFFTTMFLRRVYAQELTLLAALAEARWPGALTIGAGGVKAR